MNHNLFWLQLVSGRVSLNITFRSGTAKLQSTCQQEFIFIEILSFLFYRENNNKWLPLLDLMALSAQGLKNNL